MVKGIQLLLLLFMSHSAMAGQEMIDNLIGKCRTLGGDYEIQAIDDPDGERRECHAVKCALSENADQATVAQVQAAFPEGSGAFIGGWKTHCYDRRDSDQVLRDATGKQFEVKGFGWVDLDEFNRICGADRSRCKLDGGVWVQLPGFGIGGNGNGNGNGNSNGSGTYIHSEGGVSFRCSYHESLEACIGNDANIIVSTYGDGYNCVDCMSGSYRGGTYGVLSGIAEVAGAVLPPVMGYLGVKAQSKAYLNANQAWAGAATSGFENCRLMQTNYVQDTYSHITTNGLPDREVVPPGCEGYQLSAYAGGMGLMGNGMGGFGNPWYSAGYSPGFMGGMYGPYGMQNPYGSVFGNNGYGSGLQFGINAGMYPGMNSGMYGMNGGMYPGMNGGMYGMNGGMYPGMSGGLQIGINGSLGGNGMTGGIY
ncbi:MAG: hypothetical protein KC478_06215, partial [Bacteriovoracaceae bacterium]|nr:hypothetical protein [Bacteriovoracaceae bacterium]